MRLENSLETTANVGVLPRVMEGKKEGHKASSLLSAFLRHARYELSLSPQTVEKYTESLNWFIRDMGDLEVESIDLAHITVLKQKMSDRGAGASRIASVVFAIKSFFKYCREVLELSVLPSEKIKPPKRSRREVIFLTNEEIQRFIDSIKMEKKWDGNKVGKFIRLDGLRFRALVEVLLGTGMRISEALSLDRDTIDLEKKEAKIIGKGNKERTVFFNDRSLQWVKYYLDARQDTEEPLFVTNLLTRLKREDISGLFKRYAVKAGIDKPVHPHILRHSVATNLLFNGCPISHVKEILGHVQLETTCRFYLGIDKGKAKEAHGRYLIF